jgi:hypothetical protein
LPYDTDSILKMNFNFNLKDMPLASGQSIQRITDRRDPHHMANQSIERDSPPAMGGVPVFRRYIP